MRWWPALLALWAALPAGAGEYPQARRVLSLGGSITEIVYALGEEARLAGRDQTSLWPEAALALPDVGYVRQISPEGALSVGPDLILAEEGAGPPEAVAVLQAAGIPYVPVPEEYDAEGVLKKVEIVAGALGVPDKGRKLRDELAAGLQAAQTRAAGIATPRKVLFVLSLRDGRVMGAGAGTAADGIIRLSGAENAITGLEGYKPLSDEAIIEAAPDVILMMHRGDARVDAQEGSDKAAALAVPALAQTPAGRKGAVVVMDGLKLLGFGPRTGEAAQELHGLVYGPA